MVEAVKDELPVIEAAIKREGFTPLYLCGVNYPNCLVGMGVDSERGFFASLIHKHGKYDLVAEFDCKGRTLRFNKDPAFRLTGRTCNEDDDGLLHILIADSSRKGAITKVAEQIESDLGLKVKIHS